MSAVRGIRELFDPNTIQVTVEGDRNPQEVQNEIENPLATRVRYIRAVDKTTSEYLVDGLVKVVTLSADHSLEQAKLWEKLRNLHIFGVALSAFIAGGGVGAIIANKQNGKNLPYPLAIYSSMAVLAGVIYWLYRKGSQSYSQLGWWNMRPENAVAYTRALAYQKKIDASKGTMNFGSGKLQAFLSPQEIQHIYGEKKS